MGACATKPKELKGEAPEDVPENVTAAKDVTVVAEEVTKEVEVGADDDPEKRRSLSNLFKQVFSIFHMSTIVFLYLSLFFSV